jgi:hypothetical protein
MRNILIINFLQKNLCALCAYVLQKKDQFDHVIIHSLHPSILFMNFLKVSSFPKVVPDSINLTTPSV